MLETQLTSLHCLHGSSLDTEGETELLELLELLAGLLPLHCQEQQEQEVAAVHSSVRSLSKRSGISSNVRYNENKYICFVGMHIFFLTPSLQLQSHISFFTSQFF